MSDKQYAQKVKEKSSVGHIVKPVDSSKDGLSAVHRHKRTFRQLVWLNVILLVVAVILDFGPATRMMLIIASFLSLIVKLFNTAIEAVVGHTTTAHHELAKRAKDAGSAAQMLALVLLAVLWFMALWREYGLNIW
ncbi:diacylglycerol kinase [Neisseria montereyensis]|uniref:Diacylglycerol kinase n=1 Tax=Neisseria montereyensis TaxID=2973938 RepID=A0ABT2FAU7_9NEIS|nr:diacylglycerol kinase [Neisseria montereyensis]MCS4533353.1 diacylglycerol kinase [Neisseria montereyensis]